MNIIHQLVLKQLKNGGVKLKTIHYIMSNNQKVYIKEGEQRNFIHDKITAKFQCII